MNEFVSRNPTGRFSGLADTYDRFRPTYPAALWQFLQQHCGLTHAPVVAEIGCGTGIASRQMAQLGWQVTGVEPNVEMRGCAESRLPAGATNPRYCAGSAENTGLPAAGAELVVAAQAFHWFRADDALREFHRLLKPAGHVALFWNQRDERDAFSAAFGAELSRVSPEKAVAEANQAATGAVLLTHPLFTAALCTEFPNEQPLDRDGLIGRAYSVSFGPRDPDGRERFGAVVSGMFDRYATNGTVTLRYRTILYVARRL